MGCVNSVSLFALSTSKKLSKEERPSRYVDHEMNRLFASSGKEETICRCVGERERDRQTNCPTIPNKNYYILLCNI